jgi:hypothetical protein
MESASPDFHARLDEWLAAGCGVIIASLLADEARADASSLARRADPAPAGHGGANHRGGVA